MYEKPFAEMKPELALATWLLLKLNEALKAFARGTIRKKVKRSASVKESKWCLISAMKQFVNFILNFIKNSFNAGRSFASIAGVGVLGSLKRQICNRWWPGERIRGSCQWQLNRTHFTIGRWMMLINIAHKAGEVIWISPFNEFSWEIISKRWDWRRIEINLRT